MRTVLFDNVKANIRLDASLIVLSFLQQIPGSPEDLRFEVFRGATSIEHTKKIIRLLVDLVKLHEEKTAEKAG